MIIKTANGGKQWSVIEMPYTLMLIHPVNNNVIYVCGFYVILKTTNAGANTM
ncbi:MAG: hypothetical protein K1X85_10170 [Ignavibacteria bacterium]|nr:hypothetical protein [Ignavibacteria bacterium]